MLKRSFITILYTFILVQCSLSAETINLDKFAQDSFKENKLPLVYLHRTGCPYCEKLEEFTFDDDDVHDYIEKNFNFIEINVSHKENNVVYKNENFAPPREFAIEIGYNFFPTVLFLNKSADIEHVSVGYIEEKDFLLVLKYMKSGSYKTLSVEEYKKKIGYKDNSDGSLLDKRQKL